MPDVKQVERALEGAAEAVVSDTVAYVRNHPQYASIVQTLGERAIAAIVAELS